MHHSFWWHCDVCGEDFEAVLGALIRSKDIQYKGCSYCAGKKVSREKSFAYLHPEIMDEFAKDNTIDSYNVTEFSTKKAKWECRNNKDHKWETSFQARANGTGGCNVCRTWNFNKMLHEEHPEFEVYYDKEKNERPFNSYSNMSNEIVWWKCDDGHSFQWSILNFSRLGRFECSVCINKLFIPGENDLESQYPDLAAEFDVLKNGIGADMIAFADTNDDTWWKCSEGHEFQRSVWYRVKHVRACPICNRTIVTKGINDFQTAYQDVTKIWDYETNDKNPDEISDKNNMKNVSMVIIMKFY